MISEIKDDKKLIELLMKCLVAITNNNINSCKHSILNSSFCIRHNLNDCPVDEVIKLIAEKVHGYVPEPKSGDWPEHFWHENGIYQNKCYQCGKIFIGHKRTASCKVCYLLNSI